MISLTKSHNIVPNQETVNETKTIKRLELTPQKGGYTPERHKTKKVKTIVSARHQNSSSDSDEAADTKN